MRVVWEHERNVAVEPLLMPPAGIQQRAFGAAELLSSAAGMPAAAPTAAVRSRVSVELTLHQVVLWAGVFLCLAYRQPSHAPVACSTLAVLQGVPGLLNAGTVHDGFRGMVRIGGNPCPWRIIAELLGVL